MSHAFVPGNGSLCWHGAPACRRPRSSIVHNGPAAHRDEETACHEAWLWLLRAAVEAKAQYITRRSSADPDGTRILLGRWQDAAQEALLAEIAYWQVRDGE